MRLFGSWLFPIIILALGLAMYLPFAEQTYLWDLSEMRTAEAAREMIVTGDFFKVQINFSPAWQQPPLPAWLQALGFRVLGVGEAGARLPNALLGCLALLSVFIVGRRLHGPEFALIWALLLACPLAVQVLFRTGLPEPAFALFFSLSVACIAFAADARQRGGAAGHAAMAGLLLGFAILSEGLAALVFYLLLLLLVWVLNGLRPLVSSSDLVVLVLAAFLTSMLWFGYEWAANGPAFISSFSIGNQWELGSSETPSAPSLLSRLGMLLLGLCPLTLFALPTTLSYREKEPAEFRTWMLSLLGLTVLGCLFFPAAAFLALGLSAYPLSYLATLYLAPPVRRQAIVSGMALWIVLAALLLITGLIAVFGPVLLAAKAPWLTRYLNTHHALSPEGWAGWEGFAGLLLVFASWRILRLSREAKLLDAGLWATISLIVFGAIEYPILAPPFQNGTQGEHAALFAKLKGKECYAAPLGFNTYAKLFYAQRPAGLPCNAQPDSCFLHQKTSLTVYRVVPIWGIDKSIKSLGGYEEVARTSDYVLMRRFRR